jgi:hypothetical protein
MGLTATIATTVVTGLAGGAADAHARANVETYVSPTYGVTLEYDAGTWSIFKETDGTDGDGVDFLGLETDEIRGGFMIQIYDTQTDAGDCLEDLIDLGLEDGEDAEIREDEDGEPMEGSSRGYAYAAYNVLREDTYVANYFGCQEFGDEIGMAAFWLMVNSRDFDDGMDLIEPVIESFDDSNAHAAGEGENDDRDDEEDDRDRDEEDEDDERADDEDDRDQDDEDEDDGGQLADGVYESDLYGFELPYNAENWTLVETSTDDGHETADFQGPNRESLTVMTSPAGGSAPVDFTDYYAESFARQGDIELELYVDPETDETMERQNRNEAYALYTFEYDGDAFLLYTHAITSDNGKFVVMVVGVSLVSSYDLLDEEVFPLLDQIEF